jgi:hypothetical protein
MRVWPFRKYLPAAFSVILLFAAVTLSGAQELIVAPGIAAAADVGDQDWFQGKVISVSGTEVSFKTRDGRSVKVPLERVIPFSTTVSLSPGERVLGILEGDAALYRAVVKKVGKGKVLVAWDNGSPASTLPVDQVVRLSDAGKAKAAGAALKQGAAVSAKSAPATEGPAAGGFEVGAEVAGRSTDGYWSLGKIESTLDGKWKVRFADGSARVLAADVIQLLSTSIALKPGEQVLAIWKNSTEFSPGMVKDVSGAEATIAWEDGTAASKVKLTRIIKGQAAAAAPQREEPKAKTVRVWVGGSMIAEIDAAGGRGWVDSRVAIGKDASASVVVDGGEITAEGRIYKDRSFVGSVEKNGAIWRGSHHAGDVSPSSGTIWLEGSSFGSFDGGKLDWDTLRFVAAVLVFFVKDYGF